MTMREKVIKRKVELLNLGRRKPNPKNRVSVEVEEAVCRVALKRKIVREGVILTSDYLSDDGLPFHR